MTRGTKTFIFRGARRARRNIAARRIQSRWRGYRSRRTNRVYRSRKQKSNNITLLKKGNKKLTLKKRISILETSTKKHFDYINVATAGQPILAWGVNTGTTTNEVFSQLLAIKSVDYNGDIPAISGAYLGKEDNTREGTEIYCTKVRLRGRVLGIRPNTERGIENCGKPYTVAGPGGPTIYTQPMGVAYAMKPACQSRVHVWVFADRRPSTIDPNTGLYEPNPLPDRPQNVLQGIFQQQGATTLNTLEQLGPDAALRNYTNNRFKLKHHSVLQFDYHHPSKWFDISITVNRKLKYQPKNPALTGQPVSDPVNYNLIVFFSSVPAEMAVLDDPYFIMNDLTVPSGSPAQPHHLLLGPNLQMLSSRTYFKES